MALLLEAKRLTVYCGATRVFEEFSLNLTRGQHTAILGPNGTGKSTLFRLPPREPRRRFSAGG